MVEKVVDENKGREFIETAFGVNRWLKKDYSILASNEEIEKYYNQCKGNPEEIVAEILNQHVLAANKEPGFMLIGEPGEIISKAKGIKKFLQQTQLNRLQCIVEVNAGIANNFSEAVAKLK